jgi:hypothetical protein
MFFQMRCHFILLISRETRKCQRFRHLVSHSGIKPHIYIPHLKPFYLQLAKQCANLGTSHHVRERNFSLIGWKSWISSLSGVVELKVFVTQRKSGYMGKISMESVWGGLFEMDRNKPWARSSSTSTSCSAAIE